MKRYKPLPKNPLVQRMEDVTFPITKTGKKMNKIIAKALDKKDVDTPETGSRLTLDKLEAMEKDMHKGFKNGDLTATEVAERSRQRIIKKGTRIMVDKGRLGTDTGTFISTNGWSIGGFYGLYLSDKDNKEHIWDQTVHNITATKEYEKQNDKIPHTREYLRPISDPHHGRHVFMVLVLIAAVIIAVVVL